MITTAVYSHRAARDRTATDLTGLALWVLSVRNARRHFKRLVLLTDHAGKSLLVDVLKLPFDDVRIELDACEPEFPQIWALGKLHAYAAVAEPFVHLDHDVICWNPLPDTILSSPVFALLPEPLPIGHWRRAAYYLPAMMRLPVLPDFVRSLHANPSAETAFNTGIFGGNDLAFIADYVAASLRSLHDPANRDFWLSADGTLASVWLEQYWLSAFARARQQAVDTLVSAEDNDDRSENRYRELGFTHLWGESKRRNPYMALVQRRCSTDFPADFSLCQTLSSHPNP